MSEIISNFAVLEGCDGSGTTTQIAIITERLKKIQKPLFFPTFEPTNSQIGRIIRAALKKEINLEPETLAMLFASDRNEHLYGKDGILAHTKKGVLAVSDRYVLSSFVYQGIECGDELPKRLNSGFPLPELTIFLDIKPEIALERIKNRDSVELYEYLDFQEKVREKYLAILGNNKTGRVEIVDASRTLEEVASQIWSIITQMPIFNASENSI